MAPRLKVFEWSDGFHRFTVAAASRPKALAAWGIQQDIFASGLARQAPEAEDAEAARARPGEVVERGLTVDVGKAGPRAARVTARKGPTAAEKRRVERLADDLEALERAYADSAEAVRVEMRSLEARAAEEKRRFDQTRTKLVRDLAKAREKL
ncbi:hypothetical protein [Brevundimonas bullata]|jgi:hypothetical protein|uniref:hypothetical protein n=1 Tax=Brevundimonas bullata TaxID=13160 RepID=UPI002FDB83B3